MNSKKTRQNGGPWWPIILAVLWIINLVLVMANKKQLGGVSALKNQLLENQQMASQGLTGQYLDQLNQINQLFPQEAQVVSLVSSLNRAGQNFVGFAVDFKTDKPLTKGGRSYFPFILEIQSEPKSFYAFLNKFVHALYLVEITKLEIKSADGFINQLDALVEANLYVNQSFGK